MKYTQEVIEEKITAFCRDGHCIYRENNKDDETCPLRHQYERCRYVTTDDWNYIYNSADKATKSFYKKAAQKIDKEWEGY